MFFSSLQSVRNSLKYHHNTMLLTTYCIFGLCNPSLKPNEMILLHHLLFSDIKMRGLLLYLILSALLISPHPSSQQSFENETSTGVTVLHSTLSVTSQTVTTTQSPPSTTHLSPRPSIKPSTDQQTTTGSNQLYKKECMREFMVAGGLIIACMILLISIMALTCKVLRLNRTIKALGCHPDSSDNSEYSKGTTKKSQSKSETESGESKMLMVDLNQTQEAIEATKEEGGRATEDNNEEVGDDSTNEDASTPPAENSHNSKPQDEPTNAAPTSDGKEEPKDFV